MLLLGIETSCDDTATAVVEDGRARSCERLDEPRRVSREVRRHRAGDREPPARRAALRRGGGRGRPRRHDDSMTNRRHRRNARPGPYRQFGRRRRGGESARVRDRQTAVRRQSFARPHFCGVSGSRADAAVSVFGAAGLRRTFATRRSRKRDADARHRADERRRSGRSVRQDGASTRFGLSRRARTRQTRQRRQRKGDCVSATSSRIRARSTCRFPA